MAVDVGNSSAKFGIPLDQGPGFREVITIKNDQPIDFPAWTWVPGGEPILWSVCSVHQRRALQLAESVMERGCPDDRFYVIRPGDVDLETQVESPEKLGRDRLVACWQARQLSNEEGLVVIDAGTAVTVDIVRQSVHLGGLIFPGTATMFRSLTQQASSLPDLSEHDLGEILSRSNANSEPWLRTDGMDLPPLGQSTEAAILLGVYQTQLRTLRSTVDSIQQRLDRQVQVILTGGGMARLRSWLPHEWIHIPDLVLQGALALGRKRIDESE